MKTRTLASAHLATCLLLILLCALWLEPAHAAPSTNDTGNHIMLTVLINGQKARLAFDTGAESSVLFRKSPSCGGWSARLLPTVTVFVSIQPQHHLSPHVAFHGRRSHHFLLIAKTAMS